MVVHREAHVHREVHFWNIIINIRMYLLNILNSSSSRSITIFIIRGIYCYRSIHYDY